MLDDAVAARFWGKVAKAGPDECWLWMAGTTHDGYGILGVNRRSVRAHRISAELAGMQVDGLVVRHKCDNPPCVNPAHLEPGTVADNNRDMWERNRQGGRCADNVFKTHCPLGHPYAGDNLVIKQGVRTCRTCHNIKCLRRYYRLEQAKRERAATSEESSRGA